MQVLTAALALRKSLSSGALCEFDALPPERFDAVLLGTPFGLAGWLALKWVWHTL
jgi:hypothetical protein